MERRVHPDYPHLTLWYKDDGYFEQDEETGRLWCQTDRVWSVFQANYSPNYAEIQTIIKSLMERHYKLRVNTKRSCNCGTQQMERHYKLRG